MYNAAVKTRGHYTLKIVHDEEPINPREEWDNFGHMICWHSRYNLGDKHDYENPNAFLSEIVWRSIPPQEILDQVKDGKVTGMRMDYDDESRTWDLRIYDAQFKKWFTEFSYPSLDPHEIAPEILKNMGGPELYGLAELKNLIMPLYLLDHSGLTISTNDFHDRWDSGQIGWIYTSHADIAKEYGDASPESAEKARRLLNAEVETYDCYLRGECYGFQLFMDGAEVDSCWGFLGRFDEAKEAIREYLPEDAVPLADEAGYGDDEPEYAPEADAETDDEMEE